MIAYTVYILIFVMVAGAVVVSNRHQEDTGENENVVRMTQVLYHGEEFTYAPTTRGRVDKPSAFCHEAGSVLQEICGGSVCSKSQTSYTTNGSVDDGCAMREIQRVWAGDYLKQGMYTTPRGHRRFTPMVETFVMVAGGIRDEVRFVGLSYVATLYNGVFTHYELKASARSVTITYKIRLDGGTYDSGVMTGDFTSFRGPIHDGEQVKVINVEVTDDDDDWVPESGYVRLISNDGWWDVRSGSRLDQVNLCNAFRLKNYAWTSSFQLYVNGNDAVSTLHPLNMQGFFDDVFIGSINLVLPDTVLTIRV